MSLCLSAIVRNEIHVLPRLFASVAPHVSCAAIVDTGSTDGTQSFIRQYFLNSNKPDTDKYITLRIEERPWVNFSHNRNQALQLAKQTGTSHALIIDADEELVGTLPVLQPGISYRLNKHYGNLRYSVPAIVDISATEWVWREPVHEYLECLTPGHQFQDITTAHILVHTDGARSEMDAKAKFLADAKLLIPHRKEPRACFYLAQSYRDAGEYCVAREYFQKRANMQGWDEETWCAQYRVGQMQELLGIDPVNAYLAAYNMRPTRAEPLHALAVWYRKQKMWPLALNFALSAYEIPYPKDKLFVEHDVYAWRCADEIAVASYWRGFKKICRKMCKDLLDRTDITATDRERIQSNLNFCL